MPGECPQESNNKNCGEKAAQWLVQNNLVLIDLDLQRSNTKAGEFVNKFLVDRKGAEVFIGTLRVNSVGMDGMIDIAELGCTACGKCLRMVDEYGDVSVGIMEPNEGAIE